MKKENLLLLLVMGVFVSVGVFFLGGIFLGQSPVGKAFSEGVVQFIKISKVWFMFIAVLVLAIIITVNRKASGGKPAHNYGPEHDETMELLSKIRRTNKWFREQSKKIK